MKRQFSLILLAICLGALSSLLVLMQAQAQIDAFTYFIPFPADRLDDLFDIANSDNNFVDDNIVTTISIANQSNGVTIFYDHWEDGLEVNLSAPVQASTQVWGDNNPANGIPPGFATDVLNAGDIITLRSIVALPRDQAQIFFDGGDKLTALGGSLAVSLATWPESASTLFAGAWALLATGDWGTEYIVPVGVDLFGTGPGQRSAFGVVGVNVQAVADNTVVQLDLNADGTFETTVTLNDGQQFTDTGGSATTGAQIVASKPVQVHLFTGNPTPGVNFEARAYTLGHRGLWSGDNLASRSSDGDHWLYNPHSTPLTVRAVTSSTVTTITIPALSTTQFPTGTLSSVTGVRFTSVDGRDFEGLTALDELRDQDWGYGMLPVSFLTTQVLVGWAPGNNREPPSPDPTIPGSNGFESRVYVTALTTTTLNVDYDIDGTVDATFPITPLFEVDIVDPNDFDMTGAYLFTGDGTPFMAVWGQDESAPIAEPSIDVGTGLVPLASLAVQKTIRLIDDADGSGTITWGDTVRFQIFALNNTNFLLDPVVISDTLSASVTYLTTTSTLRGAPIPDDAPPRTPFPFDEGGFLIPGGLAPQEVVIGTFEARVNENVDSIRNVAEVDTPVAPPTNPAEIEVPVEVPRLALGKLLLDPPGGVANRGDVVTFIKTITNTGNLTITTLPLRDEYNPNHLTYRQAVPAPDLVTPGVVTWNDLTITFGPLPPNGAVNVTTSFTVNVDLPADVLNTVNTAIVSGAVASNGSVLPPLTAAAEVRFPVPTPTPRPDDDDDDGGRPSVPPPAPAAPASPPTVAPSPTVSATLPVQYLPETGLRDVWAGRGVAGGLLLMMITGLATSIIWFKLNRDRPLESQVSGDDSGD